MGPIRAVVERETVTHSARSQSNSVAGAGAFPDVCRQPASYVFEAVLLWPGRESPSGCRTLCVAH